MPTGGRAQVQVEHGSEGGVRVAVGARVEQKPIRLGQRREQRGLEVPTRRPVPASAGEGRRAAEVGGHGAVGEEAEVLAGAAEALGRLDHGRLAAQPSKGTGSRLAWERKESSTFSEKNKRRRKQEGENATDR